MADDRYGDRSHSQYYPPPPSQQEDLDSPTVPTVKPLHIHKTASPAPSAKSASNQPVHESRNDPPRTQTPQSSSGRFRFSADDPNRPTISGYASTRSPPAGKNAPYPKPLPDSPGPETPEKDVPGPAYPTSGPGSSGSPIPMPEAYMPRPLDTTESQLGVPHQTYGVNRMATHASVNTTRAERGSPPPPETPIDAGQAGGNRLPTENLPTTAGIYAQNGPSAQRANLYPTASKPEQQSPQSRPAQAYAQSGPYAVSNQAQSTPQQVDTASQHPSQQYQQQQYQQGHYPSDQYQQHQQQGEQQHVLSGQAMQGLHLQEEPPPAYTTMPQAHLGAGPTTAQGYPDEKRQGSTGSHPATVSSPPVAQDATTRTHPAFANDPPATSPSHPAAAGLAPVNTGHYQQQSPQPPAAGPTSPPPLPEGWIAHLDQNSGQYYYIHLPTQSTQWEFPKGPTPLALQEPMSPGGYQASIQSPTYSHFTGKPLGSPGYPSPGLQSHFGTYHDGMSIAGVASPTATAFTGPPPAAGVDLYRVQPSNGVYFGPNLRYTNIDLERSLWLGSILIVTDVAQPPSIHIHQSTDLSPNPRQLKPNPIYNHQRWIFYRYDIDLLMEEHATRWTYAVTSHLGCTRYEFLVAGRHETNWRFITHSGNDFALSVNANERSKVGGVGHMWKDVLQKNQECGGFHAQLGLGGQIYADRLWHDVPMLKQWTIMSGKENRKNAAWTAKHEEDVTHAYFHFYTSHFDQPHLREAFAQIPHILTLDDHDIFDGFGSYPEYMQQSNMFKNIGRIGSDMYLLFQHHTTYEILRNVRGDLDLFTITGNGWHFLKYLGPAVVVVGPDTRSERTVNQVMAGPTYQGLFPKVAMLPPSVQHCIWMIPVPLLYPRLHSANQIASTVASGKKAVTGTFNMLGKVTSSVAGIVGAKDVVNDGFHSVKKAVGKSGLMSGMLSPFGEFDVLDELRDLWTHESKDLERTYLIRTLQGISHNKSLRMTFLSGGVNCAGAGLVHDPHHPADHKTMYQLISSAIVNAPPGSMVLRMLNTNPKQPIYIPQNGHRSHYSSSQPGPITDTKEDMMEIFVADPDGRPREMKRLMGRRNYVAMVAYDPDMVQGGSHHPHSHHRSASSGASARHSPSPSSYSGTTAYTAADHRSAGRLSLAADFLVQQGDGGYGGSVKYGPVVIPSLEYGR
ncbi:hypothetical protein K461DRAFT_234494 [Myriangium duriaei CBS 260.36]|uniref:WW domain-containing protein n=1 Tax=Myriangium duriaei CBS 260.36 TaxID=1168546 RepID=A0A9P4JBU2_9PEZI|nr:hypothetical protein K461DRAFT_234494 [Myriangium duriaei CBS 260.36]